MIFIVISQRAKGNNKYSLKDLPGHGRIDVIFRVILAALRPIMKDSSNDTHIFTYLKGTATHGWLYMNHEELDFLAEDEISLAAKIQKQWNHYWTAGTQQDMYAAVQQIIQNPHVVELHAEGTPLKEWKCTAPEKLVVVLGAQRDMTEEDTIGLTPTKISLGETMYLASQAITIVRITEKLSLPTKYN